MAIGKPPVLTRNIPPTSERIHKNCQRWRTFRVAAVGCARGQASTI